MELTHRCRLIEEPEVNEQSVPTLVKGLIQSSDLFRKFPLADATPLVEYIGRKARDYRFDLQSLAVEVERMILLHVELETGRFRSPKDSDDKSSRATVHNSLIKLISMPNASNARGLVQQLGKRYRRGWGVRELITDLAMVSSSALDRSQYQLPLLSAVVWNAALLASADGY